MLSQVVAALPGPPPTYDCSRRGGHFLRQGPRWVFALVLTRKTKANQGVFHYILKDATQKIVFKGREHSSSISEALFINV